MTKIRYLNVTMNIKMNISHIFNLEYLENHILTMHHLPFKNPHSSLQWSHPVPWFNINVIYIPLTLNFVSPALIYLLISKLIYTTANLTFSWVLSIVHLKVSCLDQNSYFPGKYFSHFNNMYPIIYKP